MQNITQTLKPVSGINHPLVADMYLKKDLSHHDANILVIEAKKKKAALGETEHEAFDSYLIDLLIDLENLKEKAEAKVGRFDRIDIRAA